MRVLVADDDALSRKLLKKSLDSWGYKAVITIDGVQTWQVLQQTDAPNLVILDWMMPGMDGIDICRKVRARDNSKYTYIILLTGRSGRDDVILGLESGADDYMVKPFNPTELKYRLKIGQRIIELERRILRLASTDCLTNLLNRRAFMERLPAEMNRSARNNKPLGLIIVDVDHFKNINDSYGHQVGDLLLQEVAKTLSRACRLYDFIGRYGGEEFVVCLPGANLEETFKTAERMRAALENQKIRIPENGHVIRITASFGISAVENDPHMDMDTMINYADYALYQAKNQGRNRTVRYKKAK